LHLDSDVDNSSKNRHHHVNVPHDTAECNNEEMQESNDSVEGAQLKTFRGIFHAVSMDSLKYR
jgi:hypothetical protein